MSCFIHPVLRKIIYNNMYSKIKTYNTKRDVYKPYI